VRVATFNMRHGVGVDSVLDLDRTAEVLREAAAEVVGLQELDRGVQRSGGLDQPGVLAELIGMDVRFHRTTTTGGGEYGIAVAAREHGEQQFIRLPRHDKEEPRGAVVTRHGDINVVITHVTKPGPARALQLQRLAELARDLGPNVVLMGDLNTERHDLGPLISAGLDPGPQHPTMVMTPRLQLDYVMTGPGVELVDSWTVDVRASDHVALVAEVVLK
jgi:endonuclease/exonuclease/phosphatase family metal-dependent hydrolase